MDSTTAATPTPCTAKPVATSAFNCCGDAPIATPSSALIASVALRSPVALGAKRTVKLRFCPAGTMIGNTVGLVTTKLLACGPTNERLLTVRGIDPLLLMTKLRVVLCPTITELKSVPFIRSGVGAPPGMTTLFPSNVRPARAATAQAFAAVLVPVALPLQPHVHGPLAPPTKLVTVPVLQKLVVGADNTGVALLAVPHAPLIGVSVNEAITLQLPMTGPVVYVVPTRLPLQPVAVPAAKPLAGVSVNEVLAFWLTVCTVLGLMLPLAGPVVTNGVTVHC